MYPCTCLPAAAVYPCLERGADLHMFQLMPLPLTVSCFSKIQIGFAFLVPAHLGSPRKMAVKRVCVCVCVCELSRRGLSLTSATTHHSSPDNAIGLVAQCELSGYVKLEAVGQKFSHRPGNPATVGVARWPSAGDTVGYRLRRRPKLTPGVSNLDGHNRDKPRSASLTLRRTRLSTRWRVHDQLQL